MGFWKKQHTLRGNFLEECLNESNRIYQEKGLAVVQKIPTPITPVKLGKDKGVITLAYFDQQSTVDYIGNVQGIPVCFDAKETKLDYLPLTNVKEHQIKFMQDFSEQDGLAFLIISFLKYEKIFLFPFEDLLKYWEGAKNGARKSIPYEACKQEYEIKRNGNILIHYLEAIQAYLNNK